MRAVLVLALMLSALIAGSVVAQTDQPVLRVPESGSVELKQLPLMGEEIYGALQTSRLELEPLKSHIGNTRACSVARLWECRTWLYADGTGVQFYTRRKADGSLAIASTEFTWRVTGEPGKQRLCRKPVGATAEICEQGTLRTNHYLYDEWFVTYDRPAEGDYPAYNAVHEHFALIPGRR